MREIVRRTNRVGINAHSPRFAARAASSAAYISLAHCGCDGRSKTRASPSRNSASCSHAPPTDICARNRPCRSSFGGVTTSVTYFPAPPYRRAPATPAARPLHRASATEVLPAWPDAHFAVPVHCSCRCSEPVHPEVPQGPHSAADRRPSARNPHETKRHQKRTEPQMTHFQLRGFAAAVI